MSSGFLNCDLACCLAGLLGLFPKEDARPRPVNNGASLTEITNAPGFIPRGSKLFRDAPGAAGQPQPAFASLPITLPKRPHHSGPAHQAPPTQHRPRPCDALKMAPPLLAPAPPAWPRVLSLQRRVPTSSLPRPLYRLSSSAPPRAWFRSRLLWPRPSAPPRARRSASRACSSLGA